MRGWGSRMTSKNRQSGRCSGAVPYKLCGVEILVDREDLDRIRSQRWSVVRRPFLQFYTRVKKRRMTLARFITGARKGAFACHLNRNERHNFSKANLRVCRMTDRQASQPKRKGKYSSKFKGVSYDRKLGLWFASIRPNGLSICIGRFASEQEAADAYDEAAKKHFGEFARLNSDI